MSSVLTCDCGARFGVDALAPGQQVRCPECGQSLEPRPHELPPPRPSWLALSALALALVGGFTVVGSLAGVALGAVALLRLRRHPRQLTGSGFATSAIIIGLAMTVVSLALLSVRDRLSFGAWLRGRALTGQVEPAGLTAVTSRDGVCLLTLPSADWLRFKGGAGGDPGIDDIQQKRDALLVNLRLRAYADLTLDPATRGPNLSSYYHALVSEMQPPPADPFGDDEVPGRKRPPPPRFIRDQAVEPVDGFQGHEWLLEVQRGDRAWRLLVRAYRQKSGPVYVARAYAPRGRFAEVEAGLRELLDGVRFPR